MDQHLFRTIVAGGFAAASLTVGVLALTSPAATAAVAPRSQPELSAATLTPSQQGIIMSDGRICNPRWGC